MRKELIKISLLCFVLISAAYAPVVFYNKTLSFAARYPWLREPPPKEIWRLPERFANTFNVDLAHPAAYEECLDIFIGSQIRQGEFPLWNPFIACGSTMVEQFSTRLFFPYQLIQNVCPWTLRDFFLLGRIFFAVLGVFLFLRIVGTGFWAALCGAVLYGFSGAMTVFLTMTEMSNVGMVLPYLLFGAELLHRRSTFLYTGIYSLFLALLVLGDQPEVYFYGMVFASGYFLFRTITNGAQARHKIKETLLFFLATVCGLLIASPLFVPFLVNSRLYFSLHPPGGTMGIETATPPQNFMAVFFPDLLRWRTATYAFTLNAGWDCLGGYLGLAGSFFIIAALLRRWRLRSLYLYFLCFGMFILLKNMGLPVINWIGRLPVFDQVWTPRWTGPVWNLSLALAAALGLEAMVAGPPNNNGSAHAVSSRPWWIVLAVGIGILSVGLLANSALLLSVYRATGGWHPFSLRVLSLLQGVLIAMGGGLLIFSSARLGLSAFLPAIAGGITLCVLYFQWQLPHIECPFKSFFEIENALVLFSMWQAMVETVLVGLAVAFALCAVLRNKKFDAARRGFVFFTILATEMTFHVTVGYDETGRLLKLLVHLVVLVWLALYALSEETRQDTRVICFALSLLIVGQIATGMVGAGSLPERKEILTSPLSSFRRETAYSRVMGIKGVLFPNSAAALGIQDVKSIVSSSIMRFQVFQDRCLSVIPQSKYKSLWFTGIMDIVTERDISEHIIQRYPFYSLAGVSEFLSPEYEDFPETHLIEDGQIKVYRNIAAFPRAFLVHRWSAVSSAAEAADWVLAHPAILRDEAAVEIEPGQIAALPVLPPDVRGGTARISSYRNNSVTVEVETSAPGLLVLTDTFHPDWRVTVDNVPVQAYPADVCFRGVFVPAGSHRVRFVYFPRVFYACAIVSLFSFTAVLSVVLLKRRCYSDTGQA